MKVLFISSWYPNSANEWKGIYVKKHAGALKLAGIEVEVLAFTISDSSKLYEKKEYQSVDENGIRTHHIELHSRFYKFLHIDIRRQYSLLKKYFYKNIRSSFQPDIIHSNVLYPAAIMGHWLATKERLPHVITEHWSKVDKFMSNSLYAKSGKNSYNTAKAVTAVSVFLKNSISKHFIDPSKIHIVPNVVDALVYNYFPKQKNEKEIRFFCVAHWNDPKRPDLIFNSLQQFSKTFSKKIILNVAGNGPLLEELKIKKWDLEVNYLGNLIPQKLSELLFKTDIFLHASNMETFSIVIAEALSTGTPVLASNAGAIPELINADNGILCTNDIESWAAGLAKICSTTFDHQKIAENASNYKQEVIGHKFLTIYQSILPKK